MRYPRNEPALTQAVKAESMQKRSLTVSNRPGRSGTVRSRMPKGAEMSPCGDLGELKQLEALEVFPALKNMTDHVKRAAHRLPTPKLLRK